MTLENRLSPDLKGQASLTLGDVIRQTAKNYPDSRFHPRIYEQTTHYIIAGIDLSPYSFWVTADGIGTKPELAERLYTESLIQGKPTPEIYEGLAFDTLAMIDGDEARFGRYMVGVANVIDPNTAENIDVVSALARGLKAACDEGRFALLNGETAELGYRTSGYGKTRLNWNAFGVSVFTPEKLLLGKELAPGQPIVVFREKSIRSNGLSKARAILEIDYLLRQGLQSKQEYVEHKLKKHGIIYDTTKINIGEVLTEIFGHDAMEQVLPPWHTVNPDITRQLLLPSRLYGPVMYDAQGKIDEPRKVNMISAAHISGGGVPEKGKRMVESKGLGLAVNAIFPDPEGIQSLLAIAAKLPEEVRQKIKIDDKIACEQWNRGIGFMVVVPNQEEAKKLIGIAEKHECEAGIAGEITALPEIQFKGHTWNY